MPSNPPWSGDNPGAIWLPDIGNADPARDPGSKDAARPADALITLRHGLQLESPMLQPPPRRSCAGELVRAEPFVPPMPEDPSPPDADLRVAAAGEHEARRQRRADRRAAVRRARLRELFEAHAGAPPPEVLVLERDQPARESLCELLQRFGFVVHAAHAIHAAFPIVASHAVVAAFVGIVTDGDEEGGLAECRRVHNIFALRFGLGALLVGVAARAMPVDVVRAELAGCDELILKPVTRGAVARVLDVHDIAMPADSRRV